MSDAIVIIPTYNEIENIEAIIRAVFAQDKAFDILIVDDNSPDLTALKVKELQQEFKDRLFLLPREEKQGLGTAYIAGFKWSLQKSYAYIFEMDFASKYVRLITRMKIQDTTAGFVCYKREVLETLNLDKIKFVGYAFQIEMKFKAYLKKFRIVEVPVIFVDREKGKSKLSSGIISEAVFGVITMKFKSMFSKN